MKRRKRTELPRISAEQARQALHVLVAEGRLAAAEVARALERREKLVRDLQARLASLGAGASSAVGRAVARAASPANRRAAKRGARKAITAAQRAARQAQGQYLGAIRRLSKASRAKIREIRRKDGVKVAIAAAKKLAS